MPTPAAQAARSVGSVRVILAEDEVDAREMLAQGLARAGFEIIACADGQAALRAAVKGRAPDAIVTDLVMPNLDGLGFLRGLADQKISCLKVVVTAFADKDGTIAALNAGADHLIEKPFTANRMAEVLHRLLLERQALTEPTISALYECRLDGFALSEVERRIVTLVLKGAANRRIADVLGIQEQSVKNRLLDIYRRLGIASRTELVHLIFPI